MTCNERPRSEASDLHEHNRIKSRAELVAGMAIERHFPGMNGGPSYYEIVQPNATYSAREYDGMPLRPGIAPLPTEGEVPSVEDANSLIVKEWREVEGPGGNPTWEAIPGVITYDDLGIGQDGPVYSTQLN